MATLWSVCMDRGLMVNQWRFLSRRAGHSVQTIKPYTLCLDLLCMCIITIVATCKCKDRRLRVRLYMIVHYLIITQLNLRWSPLLLSYNVSHMQDFTLSVYIYLCNQCGTSLMHLEASSSIRKDLQYFFKTSIVRLSANINEPLIFASEMLPLCNLG